MKCLRTCFKFKTLGVPSTNANIFIEKDDLNGVFLYKLFKTTAGVIPLFNSITTRVPFLSDSSLTSDIPSIFLVLINSAIRITKLALLT